MKPKETNIHKAFSANVAVWKHYTQYLYLIYTSCPRPKLSDFEPVTSDQDSHMTLADAHLLPIYCISLMGYW